MIPNSNSCRKY